MVAPIAWPFRANWSDSITERLSWMTAIQTSRSGAEQRQALRVTPRRQIDYPLMLTAQERSYFEVLMARNGASPWHVPLPHEEIPIGYVQSGSSSFDLDPTGREIGIGTNMLVRGMDGLHSEIVEVTSIFSDHIETTTVSFEYPMATITPTFFGQIAERVEMERRTAQIYTGTVRFMSQQPTVWPVVSRALSGFPVSFLAYPVLTQEPNAKNDLPHTFERTYSVVDNSQSIPRYVDKSLRQFTGQKYEWFLYGRQAQQDFRDLLFYLQGRCKPLWVPTFNDDIAPDTGYPNPLGFESTPPASREYVIRFNKDGAILGMNAAPYAVGDHIPIAPFENNVTRRISFMSLKRLDVDDIELEHHTATDGMTTVSAIFRDAPDLRQPLDFNGVGFPKSGYWPNATADTGTRAAATNVATGLTDVLTIIGAAGGAP